MWVLKPYSPPEPMRIDLPQALSKSIGFGADVLISYLEGISNENVMDINDAPPPPTELCRICERRVPTWWFEQHCEICVLEHRAESELQSAQEALLEQRNTIASLLSAYENGRSSSFGSSSGLGEAISTGSPPRSYSSSGSSTGSTASSSSPQTPTIEYRGFALPCPPSSPPVLDTGNSTGSSIPNSNSNSNTSNSGSPPRSPLVNSVAKRAIQKSFASTPASSGPNKRSPVRFTELLLELSDMALQINIPEMKSSNKTEIATETENEREEDNEEEGQKDEEFRVHSPQSETRIHQVLGWTPSTVDDPGMALLCRDTENYARRKVDAALRLGNIIIYSEKIRTEIETEVQRVVEETIEKIIRKNEEGYLGGDDDDYRDEESEILANTSNTSWKCLVEEDEEDEKTDEDHDDDDDDSHDEDNDDDDEEEKEDESIRRLRRHGPPPIFSTAYLHGDTLPLGPPEKAISPGNVSPYQPPITQPASSSAAALFKKTLADNDGKHTDLSKPSSPVLPSTSSPQKQQAPQQQQQPPRRNSLHPQHPPAPIPNTGPGGSVTPKSILAGSPSSIPTGALNKDRSRIPGATSGADSDSGLNDEHHLGDFDLNAPTTIPRMKTRKSTSNLSGSGSKNTTASGSPISGVQKRGRAYTSSASNDNNNTHYSSPLASPLLHSHDPDMMTMRHHHRRKSSATSDASTRASLSPLLTSSVPSTKPPQPSIKDYEIISPISKGAFGSVYLSRKKLTGEYFAIKVLKKADMVAKNQVMNVKAERAILMAQSESPFVAKLFFTFQSKDYLFLVMEYLNGGDCAALIKALGGLPESWAQKYIAEVIVGVADLHNKGIVHRDLKPDNLLIDSKGHLKLTDFGLSRMGLVGRHTRIRRNNDQTGGSASPSSSVDSPVEPSIPVSRVNSYDITKSFSTNSSQGGTMLHDPNISLVPGYFNFSKSGGGSSGFERHFSSKTDSSGSESLTNQLRKMATEEEAESSGNENQSTLRHSPSTLPNNNKNTNTSGNNSSSQATNTPPMVLFDPEDSTRKFVGTPDYLAPETIRGVGQDETSDWWSLGCILFEFLYGYPPFNDDTPEKVFENILNRRIQWADEIAVSKEAKDLIGNLLCLDQSSRLGANGAEEIKSHPFFYGINNWDTLWDEKASFIPDVDNPESTDYFDLRGAVMQEFPDEMALEEESVQPSTTAQAGTGQDSQSDSSDNNSGKMSSDSPSSSTMRDTSKVKHLPLHIPPHVRDGRVRRMSESSAANEDFGTFSFKNIPVLERANKDLISKLRSENMEQRSSSEAFRGRSRGLTVSTTFPKRGDSPMSAASSGQNSPRRMSTSVAHPLPSLSTTVVPAFTQSGPASAVSPQKRSTAFKNSPVGAAPSNQAPSIPSANCDNTSETQVSISSDSHTAIAPIPIKRHSSSGSHNSGEGGGSGGSTTLREYQFRRGSSFRRLSNMESSPELREQFKRQSVSNKYNQVFDMSPCNSDTEDTKNTAYLRVQKRREVSDSKKKSPQNNGEADVDPFFRTLDVLVCDINPVWRYSTEKMLVRLGCRVVSVNTGPEAVRRATGDVKFDLIILEYRLAKTNGSDVARMIHNTMNRNTHTPVLAMTKFVKEAKESTGFKGIMEKPPTVEKLVDQLKTLCNWVPQKHNKKDDDEITS